MKFAWDRDASTSASGGNYDASRTAGTKTTFTFTGTNVSIVGRRAPDGGTADVYLDNVKQNATPVSFYSSMDQWQAVVWSKSGLSNARHVLELRVLGTKPTGSTDAWVYLDKFVVGTVAYEENHLNVVDSAVRTASTSASGGSFDRASHLTTGETGTAPTVTFTFKGTGVDWYATKGPGYGKATIAVDGAVRATVDLYAAATAYNQRVFTSATLVNGIHTVTVTLTGTRHASATGVDVTWDRFVLR